MGAEEAFGEKLATRLRQILPPKYNIETKRSLLYAVSFDDQGSLQLGQNSEREPTRGGGTGFEQDLLLFERSSEGQTSIIPRVSIELKFSRVSTHDSIVYSKKARRIRAIYPFVPVWPHSRWFQVHSGEDTETRSGGRFHCGDGGAYQCRSA